MSNAIVPHGACECGKLPTQLTTKMHRANGAFIHVKAAANNSAEVYIGGQSVAANTHDTHRSGFPLRPGEVLSLEIENLSGLWCISSKEGQRVTWICGSRPTSTATVR